MQKQLAVLNRLHFSSLIMPDSLSEKTFQNPVYERSFPDPFVLNHNGEYFAFCTGTAADGRCFGRLRSADLVNWEELSGALVPLESGEPFYWAPEVTYRNGKFYLYYSVGNEALMTIRVAVSESPDGAFVDAGIALTQQDFAIDPHVFCDDDGRWVMFYATDFLDHSHIGTGTVVDEMLDPFTLKGEPRPVTRAQFEWQVYDPARIEKGGVRWHTVEGPFVLKRKGIYYEMFSGGNWQDISYGVSFAISKTLARDQEWSQYSDGEKIPPVMRTIPGKVIGPGHNSVVRGPNGRDLYCVYHSWENDIRAMAIDRMDFAGGGRLFVIGPSDEPQPFPNMPPIREVDLTISNGQNVNINCDAAAGAFLFRSSFRFLEISHSSRVRMVLTGETGQLGELSFDVTGETKTAHYANGIDSLKFALPGDIDLSALHELSIEIDNGFLRVALDTGELNFTSVLAGSVSGIVFHADGCSTAFSSTSVTGGFEELFETDNLDQRGWRLNSERHFRHENLLLYAMGEDGSDAEAYRKIPPGNNEVSVNLRFEKVGVDISAVGIHLSKMFEIRPGKRVITTGEETFDLPQDFSADAFHQFRFVTNNAQTEIHMDASLVGVVTNTYADSLSVIVKNAEVSFDMIRHTLI